MKLEYIPDGSPDAPLIRLYEFDAKQASQLRAVFANLATKSIQSIELHDADFVDSVNHCRLTLAIDRRDRGLLKTNEPTAFLCALTAETWDNIEGLTEPFTEEGVHRFQWLNTTNIAFLLSQNGQW